MSSRSTHKIELLMSEIKERQCLWHILNPEYKNRVKKSDVWKEVSIVFDREHTEISFWSLLSNNKTLISIQCVIWF